MNTPHIHAELIKKWADNPSLPVYVFDVKPGEWKLIEEGNFGWFPQLEYYVGSNPPERKLIQRTRMCPIPVQTPLLDVPKYYVPALTLLGYREINTHDRVLNQLLFDKGLVFDNPEDAIKVTKVMLEGF